MIISKNKIVCDKCFISVCYPAVKSVSRLLSTAKNCDGWLVKDGKHYCDKCKSEV